MLAGLTRKDKLLLWTLVPLFLLVFGLHVHETARTGLAQLPVFARWVPGDHPLVGGFRLETDSSGSGLEIGDRLIRLGERDLRGQGYVGFQAIGLARTTPGSPVPLVFERAGERRTVPLEARPHPHRWARVPVLLLIPTVCVLILLRAPGSLVAQRFFLGFMLYAIGQSHFYGGPEWQTWAAAVVWNTAGPGMMWGVLRWVRCFPAEMPEERRVSPVWEWLVPGLYVVFVRLNYVLAWPLPLEWVPRVSFAAHGVSALFGVGLLAWNYAHAYPAGRRRIRWILLGTALGSVPVCGAGLAPLLVPEWEGFRGAFAVGFVASALWLGGAMLAVVRDNAFDVDRLIGATAAWALAAAAAIGVLTVGAPLLAGTLSNALGLEATTVRLALAAVLGALVFPLGARLRPQVDRIFFPERIALQEASTDLVEDLAHFRSPDELVAHAAARMAAMLDAGGYALFTRAEQRFVRRRVEELAVPADVPLDLVLPRRPVPGRVPAALGASPAAMLVPLRREARVEAFVLLGPKRSGDIFTRDEARVLTGIAAQVELEWIRFDQQAAERDSRAKTDLLAAASHDLRQPLHAVSLLTEALAGKLDDASARALVERIGTSTHELDEMLTSLLDRSKLDAGAVRPVVRTVALAPLFEQLERDFAGPAQEAGLELRVVPTGLAVHSDRLLLLRILRNLVSNAVRYTSKGAVLVAARRRGDEVALEVRDSGPGIPEDQHEQVFAAFQQLPGSSTGGLGLGLSIVQGLAGLLGHDVALRSAPGRGSTFVVLAPRSAAPAAQGMAGAREEVGGLGGRRVLVVDEDPRVRAATLAMLEVWGCETRAAEGRREALRVVREGGFRPDFVLTDYHLAPDELGTDVLRALREELGGGLRAAVVSATAEPQAVAAISRLGYPVLRKPVKPAQLHAVLAGSDA